MRKFDDDEYEEEEEEFEYDPEEELESLLHTIDRNRQQLTSALARLNALLNRHPSLQEQWCEFQSSGGISGQDFGRFLDGDMRARLIPRKGHLRLVSTRSPVVRRVRIRQPPDDAA
jgi:hypothetical protein